MTFLTDSTLPIIPVLPQVQAALQNGPDLGTGYLTTNELADKKGTTQALWISKDSLEPGSRQGQ